MNCYKQKFNLRRTDAQGLPARASLISTFLHMLCFQENGVECEYSLGRLTKTKEIGTFISLCIPETSIFTSYCFKIIKTVSNALYFSISI